MPSVSYCPECGAKTVADITPNFCSKCAAPFFPKINTANVNPPKTTPSIAKPSRFRPVLPKEAEADEEGTDVYEVPPIDNITYDIDFHGVQQGITLGEVNQANVNNKSKKKKKVVKSKEVIPPNRPKEQVLEEFKRSVQNNKPISID